MIHKWIVAFVLIAFLGGCAAFKEIGDAFREDPAEAAFTISKANLDTITEFRGLNCSPPTEDMEIPCGIVADVDDAYSVAHNASIDAYTRIEADDKVTGIDAAIEALILARESVSIAMTLDDDPARNARIYIPVILSISTLRTTLEGAR